jgi:hypothetical protein
MGVFRTMATDQQKLPPSVSDIGTELSSVPQTQNITVNKDNVLRAAKIIQDVLDNEGQQIRSNLPMLRVIAPGADQISVAAAAAWNTRLTGNADSYSVRVEQYLQSLQTLVDNLVTSARQYGYSDQQIADSFS